MGGKEKNMDPGNGGKEKINWMANSMSMAG